MQNFATIARPLHRQTDRGQPYIWDDPCAQAFNALQTAFITAPVLAYPDVKPPFVLDMDASNVGIGAVLSQPSDSGEQVIAYYSRALSKTERNYCSYLHGARFLVRTDHASLTWLLNFKNPEGQRPAVSTAPSRRAQLALTVATLRTVNGEAGCLPLYPAQVQEAQERNAALTRVRSWLAAGKRLEWADVATLDTETRAYHSQWASLEARDGVLYRRWWAPDRGANLLQLLVPHALRTPVLQLVHGATDVTVDQVEDEFRMYQTTSFEDSILNKRTDEAWRDIGLLKRGGKEVFSNLSAVMLGILVVFHSNADCERVFSLVTKNKTQYRASLSTEMISALVTRKVSMAAKGTVCHMECFSDALLRKAKSATYEAKQSRASATASRGDE
ncbi:hypothetical protein AAFF_G00182230 [Aldrovandia affinis]|uniref:Reverse transcriptase/retrotransposon-derived protein RNase H-like domain-containing protein n=1 Tax=Aldrovandia affinis TaxID=143900 RepID=A0AAD7RKD5_9TELE|nr:hypothetical protein AAFF_G00182230 [Aldrovandia affinis]